MPSSLLHQSTARLWTSWHPRKRGRRSSQHLRMDRSGSEHMLMRAALPQGCLSPRSDCPKNNSVNNCLTWAGRSPTTTPAVASKHRLNLDQFSKHFRVPAKAPTSSTLSSWSRPWREMSAAMARKMGGRMCSMSRKTGSGIS